jgi:hypothetical protein
LRDGDGARLGVVNILALGGQFVNGRRGKFAVNAGGNEQLRSVGEKLRRAALIGLDMRLVAADDSRELAAVPLKTK